MSLSMKLEQILVQKLVSSQAKKLLTIIELGCHISDRQITSKFCLEQIVSSVLKEVFKDLILA